MFDMVRRLAGYVAIAAFYAVAPSHVPAWRLDPGLPPAIVLAVGTPTPSLATRRAERAA